MAINTILNTCYNTINTIDDINKYCVTKTGLEIVIRAIRINDYEVIDKFFYSISEESLNKRFLSRKKYLPHNRISDFTTYSMDSKMFLLVTKKRVNPIKVLGLGQYWIDKNTSYAEVGFIVSDEYQGNGICTELLKYLIFLAKDCGVLGLTAEVRTNNIAMKNVFDQNGFKKDCQFDDTSLFYKLRF